MKKVNAITEISFKTMASRHYVPWLIALLFFLLMFLVSIAVSFGGFLSHWQKDFNNVVSIEIPIPTNSTTKTQKEILEKTKKSLQSMNGFKKASIVSQSQIKKLLEPWLGKIDNLEALNLPIIVDIEFALGVTPNKQIIKDLLRPIDANIHVEKLSDWQGHVNQKTSIIQILCFVLIGSIIIAMFALIVLITRSSLINHQPMINLLRLMGAKYSYIIHQFQSQAFWVCIQGTLIGLAFLVLAAIILGYLSYCLNVLQMYSMAFSYTSLFAILIAPLITALMSALTARLTVLKFLKKHNP